MAWPKTDGTPPTGATQEIDAYDLNDVLGGKYGVLAYGGATPIDLTGVVDATTQVNSAIAAVAALGGGALRFPQGRYKFSGDGLDITTSNFHLVGGPGVIFDGSGVSTGNGTRHPVIAFHGTQTTGVTTVTADVAKGATSIAVASGTGFAVGQVYQMRSNDNFNPDRSTCLKGEFIRVAGVSGTTITLESPTYDSYTAASVITLDRLTFLSNVGVRDIEIIGSNVNSPGQRGVLFEFCERFHAERVRSYQTCYSGVEAYLCASGYIANCHPEGVNESGLGYGVLIQGAEHVTIVGCKGRQNRHSIEISGNDSQPLVTRHVRVIGCSAEDDDSAGFSSHPGSEFVHFVDNDVSRCGGGIVPRGRAQTVSKNRVYGSKTQASDSQSYQHGILLGDLAPNTPGNGLAGTDLVCENNVLDLSPISWGSESASGIYCSAPLVNARIVGNVIRGCSGTGISVQPNKSSHDFEISGNQIDCAAQAASQHGIEVNSDFLVGSTIKRAVFSKNIIKTPTGSGIRVRGHLDNTDQSEHLVFEGNVITSYGNRGIDLVNGFLGLFNIPPTNILVPGAGTLANAIAVTTSNFQTPPYYMRQVLNFRATWDPPSLADGASDTSTFTVTGAALGDHVDWSFSQSLAGLQAWAYVSSANTVTIARRNNTGGAVDLASGILRIEVSQR